MSERRLLHEALDDFIDRLNQEGGSLTGMPPGRENREL